ncbi:unnamed protein product [Adineta steineri]|uniref:PLAT domain-containing protein n=1 Tax=Adineta steineri TaxID=433720 RepID=A0A813VNC8_9BILA|nr:unnamed protein product [Adineta steineri]
MKIISSRIVANYNPLIDPHLKSYFSKERIQSHLKHAGLVNRRGEILSDSEYRLKLARQEQKKHVRQMLAENIVYRAIDMERSRQAELRRQIDIATKTALVNSVKGSRKRTDGSSSINMSKSDDVDLKVKDSSWSQNPRKSTSLHRDTQFMNEEFDGQSRILRVQSANVRNDLHRKQQSSKTSTFNYRPLNRPKSVQNHRSLIKSSDSSVSNSPCRITMIYYGPNTKLEYDHSLFESTDEIMVMQQHCGGENLIVYKANLKPGDEFTFNSRRHSDYPLGLSLYVKGLIDSRISTCCEYKHRHGVRLGGERGHFAIISVEGSKPCLKCRFEKQTRAKENLNSSKDFNETEDEDKKPITISIPVSQQLKRKQTSIQIPVRHTPDSDENYSDDFDEPDKRHASKSNENNIKTQQSASKARSTSIQRKSSVESNSTSSSTKPWQIIFHSSNIPTGSFQFPKNNSIDAFLKLSLISKDETDESEQYKINMRDFPQCFKSGRQDLFKIKLRDIGKPKQIRLKLEITDLINDDIKWHLDYIELIDSENESHYKFSCNQWIRPSQEKILNLIQSSEKKKSLTNTNNSQKTKISSHSSSSSSDEFSKQIKINKISLPNQTQQQLSTDDDENYKTHYRIIIYPSKSIDGEFNALNDSRIFVRLNNQKRDSFLYKDDTKSCPSFQAGENQTFELNFDQNITEQPTKLTIGYYNSDINARKWKIHKIVLINTETGEETIFPCKEALTRNDSDLRAEHTYQAHIKQSDDDQESTSHTPIVTKHTLSPSPSEQNTQVQSKANNHIRFSPTESVEQTTIKTNDNEKFSPINSPEETNNEHELDSSSRPKTRRGRQDTFDKDNDHEDTLIKPQPNNDIWRPSSQLDTKELIDPLIGLDDLQDQTSTSKD